MKKIIFILILAIGFIACSKKNNVDDDIPKDIPAWLRTEVIKVKKSEYSDLYRVAEYQMDGTVFYTITPPQLSCVYCTSFDANGTKINISFSEQEKIVLVRTIWPVKK